MLMKRTALLFLSFIPFFISHLTYSQNEIRYSRDTTFLKELRPIYDDMTDYEVLNLWVKRIDETIKKRRFFDFELACRNYTSSINNKMNIDSFELYTNHLFNYLDDAKIAEEYKIILSFIMSKTSFNEFKLGEESLKWNFKGQKRLLNKVLADSLSLELVRWREYSLESFFKYHFPYSSKNQNFAHFFLNHYPIVKVSEKQINDLEYLVNLYKQNSYWEEYVSANHLLWDLRNIDNRETWFNSFEQFKDNEYVSYEALIKIIKDIYGIKNKVMNLDRETYLRINDAVSYFKGRFPNSVYMENIDKFEKFFYAKHFNSTIKYHHYNTPTILNVESYQADTLFYYHFTKHDSRRDVERFNGYSFAQKGVWTKHEEKGVLYTDLYALPAVEAVQHYLIISAQELQDFIVFDTTAFNEISFPFAVNIHVWNEISYAIKRTEESFASYLLVQDHHTGKALHKIPVYNEQGVKVNETNKQGITTYKLRDSYHYMIHGLDTFSVDESRHGGYIYREPLIEWDAIVYWFEQFEWYGISERQSDARFVGFTDRSRYRPGDTVYYKAFVHLKSHGSGGKFIPYFLNKTSVVLYNSDGNIIFRDTVKINGHHAATGFFVIPKDTKLGRHRIEFNGYSNDLDFKVENYIDQKYVLKLGEVNAVYRGGDTVEFIAHIESRTGERFPGVKVVVEGDSVITREGMTDHNGAFVVRTKVVKSWKGIVVKAYLPTGEVLSERKEISFTKNGYRIKSTQVDSERSKLKLTNQSDVLQKDTMITVLHYGKRKSSVYSDFYGQVHFSKEDFVKWYPLALSSRDTIVKRQNIHSRDTISNASLTEFSTGRFVVDQDTIALYTNRFYSDDISSHGAHLVETRAVRGKKKYRNIFHTEHQKLTYLKRKRNGHFVSKDLIVVDGQKNNFLKRKLNKNGRFEIISKDGHLDVQSLQGNKYYRYRDTRTYLIWDSIPAELYPGQEYTVGLKVKKGKRYVRPELSLFMAKEEHTKYYLSNLPYGRSRRIFSRRYSAYRYQNSHSRWKWIKMHNWNKDLRNPKTFINLKDYLIEVYNDNGDAQLISKIEKFLALEEVIIRQYIRPLIDKDAGAAGVTITREDIAKLPVRSADGVARTVAGLNDMGGLSIRGSRTDGDYYYIDGVKVQGSANLPMNALEEVEIITGGLPASFGDTDLAMEETEGKLLSFDQIRERTRFGDTQFFIPNVKRKGKHYQVTFTQNDEITAWNLMAVAGTRNYKYAQGNQRLISVQPVQLVENTPRFLRVGDTVFLSANVFNRTNDSLVLQPSLNFYHSVSNENMNVSFGVNPLDKITVGPQQTKEVTWKVVVPTYFLQTVNMEMAVAGKQFGDRFTKSISVLQRKGIYEVGQSFVKMEGDTLQLVLDQNTFLSETAEVLDAHFYLNGNKEIEYLITRGKELKEVSLLTSPQIARHWALIAELHELVVAKPALKTLLDREYAATLDSIGAHANETFKVLELTNRLFVIMQLQELIPQEAYASTAKKLKEELFKFQDEEGKYRWLQASEKTSNWATSSVIHYLAKVKSFGFEVDSMLYTSWAKDLEVQFALYLKDRKVNWWNWHFYRDLDNYVLLKDNWSIDFKQVWECIKDQYWKSASTTAQLYFAQLALNTKDDPLAKQIAKSILNVTSYSKNKGRFIAKQERGSELQNQAELILLLEKLGGYNKEIVQLQQYMRIHQDYNTWSNNKNASHYLRALICGDSQEALVNKNVRVTVNGKTTEVELTKNQEIEIVPDQKQWDISIVSHPELVVTGGLKVKMMDEMDNVKRSTDDQLRLERLIYFKKGESWIHTQEGTEIPLGSTIRMDLVLTAANEFSYLQVDMPRITGLEFKDKTSGYRWGRVRHYAEYRNDVLRLYIDRIREGQTTLSFEGVVTNAGTFLFAPSSVTSEKNSEIGATDKAMKVKVKK